MTNDCANGRAQGSDAGAFKPFAKAREAAPVDAGDTVLVHRVEGVPESWMDGPVEYTVRSVRRPNNLRPHRNEYLIRAHHPNPPYMADGCGDTVLLLQERRGGQWEVPDDV